MRSILTAVALCVALPLSVWSSKPVNAAEKELPWIKPADNPLIGGWQLIEEADLENSSARCPTGMKFEPARQTAFLGGSSAVGPARYFSQNGAVVVIGKTALVDSPLLPYHATDHDHMERHDYLLCRYQRGDPSQQAQAQPPSRPGCPSQEVLEQMQHPDPQTPMTFEQANTIIDCSK